MNMEIIFLGTSAGIPTKSRNVSSIVLKYKDEVIFIDVGEGTQRQAIFAGIGLRKKMKIIITHLHGDHTLGLIPMIQTLTLFKRRETLKIYGPLGIKRFLDCNIRVLDIKPSFKIDINYLADGKVFDCIDYKIKAIKNTHAKYSYSLIIEEKSRPGRFNPKKAIEDGIPVKFWKDLKLGKDVIIDGKVYRYQDYVGPPLKGRKIVISGDTRPFNKLINLAKNADVLIHEATFASDKKNRSRETLHSTAEEAAIIAKKARVKILILTHFSARYNDVKIILDEARKIFPATFAAEDLMKIEIPFPKRLIMLKSC